jgi:hypothetical protein
VGLNLSVVQSLAPDQGVLDSAGKLLQPKHWVRIGHDAVHAVVWGECQGSGANPYLVVAEIDEHGYKCTCPSRKFPCKHVIGLMWRYVETPQQFQPLETPPWVIEWLGRRRRGAAAAAPAEGGAGKSIARARAADPVEEAPSPEAIEKRARQAARRKADTEAAVRAVLVDLDQWLRDQLRGGIAAFLDDAPARCRRIAARLVDAKCAVLASRVDELPARLFALPRELRAEAALHEFGQWVALCRAWSENPDDADARGAVMQSPTREAVLGDPGTRRVRSTWEVVGLRTETRRDGLVSQATWLLDLCAEAPRFALLQDFFPASAGRRTAPFSPGQRLDAELAYFPGRWPLRAVVSDGGGGVDGVRAPRGRAPDDPLSAHRAHLALLPWANLTPLLLGAGTLRIDGRDEAWWVGAQGAVLRVRRLDGDAIWRGTPLAGAVALWNGFQASLLRIDTSLGVAHPDD